jgi:ribosome-associated heat shock protein Hsp15
MAGVRIDKWLWAARFFKTRSLAARACELGRIQFNGQLAKAAREVHIGDMLQVTNDSGVFQVEVLILGEVRGPASVAQTLYRETEASRELRLKVAAERKAMKQFESCPRADHQNAIAAKSSSSEEGKFSSRSKHSHPPLHQQEVQSHQNQ